MNEAFFAYLFLTIGCALLVAEFFIPSAGILLLSMIGSICASLYYAYQAWFHESSTWFFSFVLLELVLIPSLAAAVLYILPRTKIGKRILLEGPKLEDVTAFKESESHFEELVGQFGKTLSRLNPGGMMSLQGERIHCFTEGFTIQRGETVKVVRVAGSRLVVRQAEPGEEQKKNDLINEPELEVDTKEGLDFDVP